MIDSRHDKPDGKAVEKSAFRKDSGQLPHDDRLEKIRGKMESLGLTPISVDDAVLWARSKK